MPLLYRYIATTFLFYTALSFGSCVTILLFFDLLDIIRSGHTTSLGLLLEKVFVRNYINIQRAWLFIILFSSILTYQKLMKHSELIAMKAAGISTLQSLTPVCAAGVIVGILHVTILNPIGAFFIERLQYHNRHANGSNLAIAVARSGLWLKQKQDNMLLIIHGLKLIQPQNIIQDFSIYYTTLDGAFIKRVDAEKAQILPGKWLITNAVTVSAQYNIDTYETLEEHTNITIEQIENSLASPEILSFWQLFSFIKSMQESGFSALQHQLYFFKLLFTPVLFIGVALIGYSFGISMPRYGKVGLYVCMGLIIGFCLHLCTDFISAIALAGSIPIIIAPLLSSVLCVSIGIYCILHYE